MTSKFAGLAIETEKPARMVIHHPHTNLPVKDQEGKEAFIDLYSADSDIGRKAKRAAINARLATRNRNALTADRFRTEETELYADLTVGWYLVDISTGLPIDLPFRRAEAIELYGDDGLAWLREQVEGFVGDRANFSTASSTS